MDRAETIRLLRALYQDGGIGALSAACDDIRESGQLHDPEFILCLDCGTEWEHVPKTLNGTRPPLRCPTCALAALAEAQRRYQANRRSTP